MATASAPSLVPTVSLRDMLDEAASSTTQPKWSVVVPHRTSGDASLDLAQRPRRHLVQGERVAFYVLLEHAASSSQGGNAPTSSLPASVNASAEATGTVTASASEQDKSVTGDESVSGSVVAASESGEAAWLNQYRDYRFEVAILTDDTGNHTSATVVPGKLIGEERSTEDTRQSPQPILLPRKTTRRGGDRGLRCVFPLFIPVAIAPQYLDRRVRLSVSVYPPASSSRGNSPTPSSRATGTVDSRSVSGTQSDTKGGNGSSYIAQVFTALAVRQPLHVTAASALCRNKTFLSVSIVNTKHDVEMRLRDAEFHLRTTVVEKRSLRNTLSPLADNSTPADEEPGPIRFEDSFRSSFHAKKMPLVLKPGERYTFTIVVEPVLGAQLAQVPAGDFLTLLTLTWTSNEHPSPIQSPYYLRWTRPVMEPLVLSLRYPSTIPVHRVFVVGVTIQNLQAKGEMDIYLLVPSSAQQLVTYGNTAEAALVDSMSSPPPGQAVRGRSQSSIEPSRSSDITDGNGAPSSTTKRGKLASRLSKLRGLAGGSKGDKSERSREKRERKAAKKEKRLSLRKLKEKDSASLGTTPHHHLSPSVPDLTRTPANNTTPLTASAPPMSAASSTDLAGSSPRVIVTPSPQPSALLDAPSSPQSSSPGRFKRPLNRSLRFSDSYNINPFQDMHDPLDINDQRAELTASSSVARMNAADASGNGSGGAGALTRSANMRGVSPARHQATQSLLHRTSSAPRLKPRSRRTHSDFDISLDSETDDTASDVSEDGSADVLNDSVAVMSEAELFEGPASEMRVSEIALTAIPDLLDGYVKSQGSDAVLCVEKTAYLGRLQPQTSTTINLHFVALKEGFTSLGPMQIYDRTTERYYHLREEATLCIGGE